MAPGREKAFRVKAKVALHKAIAAEAEDSSDFSGSSDDESDSDLDDGEEDCIQNIGVNMSEEEEESEEGDAREGERRGAAIRPQSGGRRISDLGQSHSRAAQDSCGSSC